MQDEDNIEDSMFMNTAMAALKDLASENSRASPMSPRKAFAENIGQQVRATGKQLSPKSFLRYKSKVTSVMNDLEIEFLDYD